MTEPQRIQFLYGYPVPARDHASLLASYDLLVRLATDECLPVRVTSRRPTSFFEDWEITRAAFMARMASTLRHLGYLAPSYSRLDGFALARTLLDHVITFAWISADPTERLPAFLRESFSRTLDKHKAHAAMGEQLLDDDKRKRLRAYVRENKKALPGLPRLAEEADAAWRERVVATLPPKLHIGEFKTLYDKVYDQYSTFDHPSTLGLGVFVHIDGRTVTVDGEPERNLDEDLRPYRLAMFAFAQALIVSHLASRRPRLRSLQRVLGTVGSMRELERDGRLVVTVSDDGTVTIGVASEEDSSEMAT